MQASVNEIVCTKNFTPRDKNVSCLHVRFVLFFQLRENLNEKM